MVQRIYQECELTVGTVDENDLNIALNNNTIIGAAIEVCSKEPAKEDILFNNPKIILTSHIAASTTKPKLLQQK